MINLLTSIKNLNALQAWVPQDGAQFRIINAQNVHEEIDNEHLHELVISIANDKNFCTYGLVRMSNRNNLWFMPKGGNGFTAQIWASSGQYIVESPYISRDKRDPSTGSYSVKAIGVKNIAGVKRLLLQLPRFTDAEVCAVVGRWFKSENALNRPSTNVSNYMRYGAGNAFLEKAMESIDKLVSVYEGSDCEAETINVSRSLLSEIKRSYEDCGIAESMRKFKTSIDNKNKMLSLKPLIICTPPRLKSLGTSVAFVVKEADGKPHINYENNMFNLDELVYIKSTDLHKIPVELQENLATLQVNKGLKLPTIGWVPDGEAIDMAITWVSQDTVNALKGVSI